MSKKYFLELNVGGKPYCLAFSFMFPSKKIGRRWHIQKLNLDNIKEMKQGTWKNMYDLEEVERILKIFYKYRKNEKYLNDIHPKISPCNKWIKANKSLLK